MNPADLVQRQLVAYNARDLQAFVACYSPDVQVYRPPAAVAAITGSAALADFYAEHRFKLPDLHAELLNRMVPGAWAAEGRRLQRARNRHRRVSPPAPRGQALGLSVLPSGTRFSRVSLRRLLPPTLPGNKVVDHERVSGVREQPFEAAVVYEADGAHIRRVWFFNAD